MTTGPLARGFESLRANAEQLEAALRADEASQWTAAANTLASVKRLDDYLSCHDASYYGRRDGDPQGKTVAGLVYVRNLVDHGMAIATALGWQRTQVRVRRNGDWVLANMKVRVNGQWVDAEARTATRVWANFGDLPLPGIPEKNGRDLAYVACVAGKPIMLPVNEALRFFGIATGRSTI
jgi:hypothetical protein